MGVSSSCIRAIVETFVIDYGRNLANPSRRVFKDEKELREVLEPRLGHRRWGRILWVEDHGCGSMLSINP